MENFIFLASDSIKKESFHSLASFDEHYDEWFNVVLNHKNEIQILFDLLEISKVEVKSITCSEYFEELYDYSLCQLPIFNQEEFDHFYGKWLKRSGRETSMDEYGQLIFLLGQSEKWNSKRYRFVLQAGFNE